MKKCRIQTEAVYQGAHAETSTGRRVAEETNHGVGGNRRVLHAGVMWRHSHAVRSRWQRRLRDLRRVETGRCYDHPMQTLWF
jgi:hypothetical protein